MQGIKHITGIGGISPQVLFEGIIPACVEMIECARRPKLDLVRRDRKVTIFAGEDSTRTAGSYGEAAELLGWRVTRENNNCSSLNKHESWLHTARTWANYNSDVIALRTTIEGVPRWLAEQFDANGIPTSIQNMGDGKHEHPSQTILDLVTIHQKLGRLDNFTIGIVGDLIQSRVVKSILTALHYRKGISVVCIAPSASRLPARFRSLFSDYEETDDMEALGRCDVVMILRWQAERFKHPSDALDLVRLSAPYQLNRRTISFLQPHAIVMHPLPIDTNINEIAFEVQNDPRIAIWEQEWYGLPSRMALLEMAFYNRMTMSAHLPEKPPEICVDECIPLASAIERQKSKHHEHFIPVTSSGCVIDHLDHRTASVLQDMLEHDGDVESYGLNAITGAYLSSIPPGKKQKDLLIIRGQRLSEPAMIKIAALAPNATFNIIESDNFLKIHVRQEQKIVVGVGKCANEACITASKEPGIVSRFININHGSDLFVCNYCGKDHSIHELIQK